MGMEHIAMSKHWCSRDQSCFEAKFKHAIDHDLTDSNECKFTAIQASKGGQKQTACMSKQQQLATDTTDSSTAGSHEGRGTTNQRWTGPASARAYSCAGSRHHDGHRCPSENAHPPTLHPDSAAHGKAEWTVGVDVGPRFRPHPPDPHSVSPETLTPPLTTYRAARRRPWDGGARTPGSSACHTRCRIANPTSPCRSSPLLAFGGQGTPGKECQPTVCRPPRTLVFPGPPAQPRTACPQETAQLSTDCLLAAHGSVGEAQCLASHLAIPGTGSQSWWSRNTTSPLPLRISTSLITEDPPSRSKRKPAGDVPTPKRA